MELMSAISWGRRWRIEGELETRAVGELEERQLSRYITFCAKEFTPNRANLNSIAHFFI